MKYHFIIAGFLLLPLLTISQNNSSNLELDLKISTLNRLLAEDKDSFDLLIHNFLDIKQDDKCSLAWYYYFNSKNSKQPQGKLDSAFAIAKHCSSETSIRLYNLLGNDFNLNGDNTSSLKCHNQIEKLSSSPSDLYSSAINKANIFLDRNNTLDAIQSLNKAKKYLHEIPSSEQANFHSIWGYIFLNKNELDSARFHYSRNLILIQDSNDQKDIITVKQNLGIIEHLSGNLNEAKKIFLNNLKLSRSLKDEKGEMYAQNDLGLLYLDTKEYNKALQASNEHLRLAQRLNSLFYQKEAMNVLSEIYKKKKDFKKSMEYFKKYVYLKDSLINVDNTRNITEIRVADKFQNQLLKDSLQILKTREALNIEEGLRKSWSWIAFITAIAALLTTGLFFINRKEKRKSEHLLLNILPKQTAKELNEQGFATPRKHHNVSILFLDIVNFTKISVALSPEELVQLINTFFVSFDDIINLYKLEKIKTIGDAYLAVDHITSEIRKPVKLIQAAIEMIEIVEQQKNNPILLKYNLPPLQIRIGIHTGSVIAGVVGKIKFQFDIWGDAVNIASRLESNSLAGKINISKSTYDLTKSSPNIHFESRGKINTKNRGEMEMFFASKSKNKADFIPS